MSKNQFEQGSAKSEVVREPGHTGPGQTDIMKCKSKEK